MKQVKFLFTVSCVLALTLGARAGWADNPTIIFTEVDPEPACIHDNIQFEIQVQHEWPQGQSGMMTFQWNFGGAGMGEWPGPTAHYKYQHAGTYTVQVTVIAMSGGQEHGRATVDTTVRVIGGPISGNPKLVLADPAAASKEKTYTREPGQPVGTQYSWQLLEGDPQTGWPKNPPTGTNKAVITDTPNNGQQCKVRASNKSLWKGDVWLRLTYSHAGGQGKTCPSDGCTMPLSQMSLIVQKPNYVASDQHNENLEIRTSTSTPPSSDGLNHFWRIVLYTVVDQFTDPIHKALWTESITVNQGPPPQAGGGSVLTDPGGHVADRIGYNDPGYIYTCPCGGQAQGSGASYNWNGSNDLIWDHTQHIKVEGWTIPNKPYFWGNHIQGFQTPSITIGGL